MCRPVTCRTCGKTTWAGCGRHVEQVMRAVPADRRCEGHAEPEPVQPASLLGRILARRAGR